jgi:AcrR family transcriptional regulator
MTVNATAPAARPPGRPRSARADAAILDAALQLLVEEGYSGMSMEGIAARAGVGKTTIYRRWPSKEAVVAAALGRLTDRAAIPDTGAVRDDLLQLIREFRDTTMHSIVGPAVRRVLSASLGVPEFMAIFRANLVEPRRAALIAVLRRGQARGDVRADVDPAIVADMLGGTMFFTALVRELRAPPSDEHVTKVVDTLLEGIVARRALTPPPLSQPWERGVSGK